MRFIADSMFGRLAKRLRMLGYDTEYVRDNDRQKLYDPEFRTARLLLTTDRKLKYKQGEVFYFTELDPVKQLALLRERFGLTSKHSFTVCMECNSVLNAAVKENVKEKVPEGAYRDFGSFTSCPGCGRVYWQGTHYAAMKEKMGRAGF